MTKQLLVNTAICYQELLEALKHDSPIWKRESRGDEINRWLIGNTQF